MPDNQSTSLERIAPAISENFARAILMYFSAQILISLTHFNVLLTALHFSLAPR